MATYYSTPKKILIVWGVLLYIMHKGQTLSHSEDTLPDVTW